MIFFLTNYSIRCIELVVVTYFIAEEGTEFVKIGMAYDVRARVRGLQTGNPRKLITLLTVKGNYERQLRALFASTRVPNTEWHQKTPAMEEFIAERLKNPDMALGKADPWPRNGRNRGPRRKTPRPPTPWSKKLENQALIQRAKEVYNSDPEYAARMNMLWDKMVAGLKR